MYKMTKTQLAAILGIKDVTIEDVLNEIDYAKLLGQTCSGIDDERLFERLKALNEDEGCYYHELFEHLQFENNNYEGKELKSGWVYIEDGNGSRYGCNKEIWDEIKRTWIDNNRLEDLIEEYGEDAEDKFAGCLAKDSLEYNKGYEEELKSISDIMDYLDELDVEQEMSDYIDALLEIADELEAEESNNQ